MINRYTVIILAVVALGLSLIINRTTHKSESVVPSVVWAQTTPQPEPAASSSDTSQVSETAPTPDIRNLMQTNTQLETYIEHLLTSISALEDEKRQYQDELTETREREQQARQNLDETQQQVEESQALQTQLQERHQAAAEQLTTVESQLQTCTQQLQETQTTRAEAEQRHQQTLDTQRQDIESLRAELSNSQQTTQQTLEQARQQLQNCAEEAKEALAAQAQHYHEAMTEQQQKVEALQAAQNDTQQQIASTQQALAQTKAALQSAQTQQAQLETRYQETSTSLDTAQQQLQNRTMALEELQSREQAARDSQAQMAERLHGVHEQLGQHLTQEIQEEDVTLQQNGDHVLVRLGGKTLFMQGQAGVRSAGQNALKKISDVLKSLPDYDVLISGHADNLPLGGALRERWSSNWTLSAARASAVANYLEHQGIAPKRMTAMGYSFYRPLNHEDSPVGRMKNRRVEIVVMPVSRLNGKAS